MLQTGRPCWAEAGAWTARTAASSACRSSRAGPAATTPRRTPPRAASEPRPSRGLLQLPRAKKEEGRPGGWRNKVAPSGRRPRPRLAAVSTRPPGRSSPGPRRRRPFRRRRNRLSHPFRTKKAKGTLADASAPCDVPPTAKAQYGSIPRLLWGGRGHSTRTPGGILREVAVSLLSPVGSEVAMRPAHKAAVSSLWTSP